MNSPSWNRTLILAVLLTALATTAYWIAFKKNPETEEKLEAKKKVFLIEGRQVSKITLERNLNGKSDKLTIVCLTLEENLCKPGDNSKWQISEPGNFKADDSATNSLLSALTNWVSNDPIDLSDEDAKKRLLILEEYHLDEKSREASKTHRVTVETDQGSQTAYFGAKHPIENNLFVGVSKDGVFSDQRIYLLPEFTLATLDQPLSYWRDKRLLSLTQAAINSFKMGAVEGKKTDQAWQIQKGSDIQKGDRDRIDAWLSGLLFLNAKGFETQLKKSSLKKVLEISLNTEKENKKIEFYSKTFRDGKKSATQVYATVTGLDPLFEMDTTILERVNLGFEAFLQNRLISTPERVKITWIKVDGHRWVKKEDQWTPSSPQANIDAFLDRISTQVIEKSVNTQSVPSGTEIQFGENSTTVIADFIFWASDGKFFAYNKKSKDTFQIDPEAWSLIPHGN